MREALNASLDNPLTILRKISRVDLNDPQLMEWLGRVFKREDFAHPDEIIVPNSQGLKDIQLKGINHYRKYWLKQLDTFLPQSSARRLAYLAAAAEDFTYPNLLGDVLPDVWNRFFAEFPQGQVWILDVSDDWYHTIWEGERILSKKTGYADVNSDLLAVPQSATGFQIDNILYYFLHFISCSVHPLIIFDHVLVYPHNILLYIPDQSFSYSLVLEVPTIRQDIVRRLLHVFDDQWTFDSARGPKWQVDPQGMNPIENLAYIEWCVNILSERMCELVHIVEPEVRAQFAWTANRLLCDAIFCLISELPYVSKVFFFGFLDKLANLLAYRSSDDAKMWRKLVDPSFLRSEVTPSISLLPDLIGDYQRAVVDRAVEEFEIEQISPEDMRAIRNSLHGYFLHKAPLDRLMTHSGEINNDLTLLVAPLTIYLMRQPWSSGSRHCM